MTTQAGRSAANDAAKRARVMEFILRPDAACLSDHRIATACEVSQPFVSRLRRRLASAARPEKPKVSADAGKPNSFEVRDVSQGKQAKGLIAEPLSGDSIRSPRIDSRQKPLASDNPRETQDVRPLIVPARLPGAAQDSLRGGTGDLCVISLDALPVPPSGRPIGQRELRARWNAMHGAGVGRVLTDFDPFG